jgi:hypothetical protein
MISFLDMRALRSSLSSRVHRRLCLGCGFDGPALQGGSGEDLSRCPRCGEDLCARPPRSYAELEGLDEELVFASVVNTLTPPQEQGFWSRIVSSLRRLLGGR